MGKQIAEFGPRHWHRHAAEVGYTRPDLLIGEAGVNFAIELLDDPYRSSLRRSDSTPRACFIAWQKIAEGWYLWQGVPARFRGYAERAQLAGSDISKRPHHSAKCRLHL